VIRRDHALVLKRYVFGESSLVVHVLTRNHGRVPLVAKGAYRPTSGYFCVLDYFDTLELEWSPGAAELAPLRRGAVAVRRRRVAADLARYRAGLSAVELAELASRPGADEGRLFEHLSSALDALDAADPDAPGGSSTDPGRTLVVFELRFLQNLGLAPALTACAACGGAAPPLPPSRARVAFSAGAGGRLCRRCADEARASGRRVGTLPLDVVEAAQALAAGERPALAPELLVRVRDFVERFLSHHLETLPKTYRSFLSAPNRNAPRDLR